MQSKGKYLFQLNFQVNVYVKPPISLPPTSDAGRNQEISLPLTWVTLDGSASKDDVNITFYNWTQVSGPNQVIKKSADNFQMHSTYLNNLLDLKFQIYKLVAHWLSIPRDLGSSPDGGEKIPHSFLSCNLIIELIHNYAK